MVSGNVQYISIRVDTSCACVTNVHTHALSLYQSCSLTTWIKDKKWTQVDVQSSEVRYSQKIIVLIKCENLIKYHEYCKLIYLYIWYGHSNVSYWEYMHINKRADFALCWSISKPQSVADAMRLTHVSTRASWLTTSVVFSCQTVAWIWNYYLAYVLCITSINHRFMFRLLSTTRGCFDHGTLTANPQKLSTNMGGYQVLYFKSMAVLIFA